ncbi:hypothetical protein BLA9940_04430 [Burkholderia aenigmatica]|nr:hypothetical protein BLA9940_04430 [Burkholderia aenigmatica]
MWSEMHKTQFASMFRLESDTTQGIPHQATSRTANLPVQPSRWDNERISNWILAFAPLIAFVLRFALMGIDVGQARNTLAGNPDPEVGLAYVVVQHAYWWVTPLVSVALSYTNFHFLKVKTGITTKDMGRWVVLVPVFMFKRAKLLNDSKTTFYLWVGLYILVAIAWMLIGLGAADMVAADTAQPALNIFGN